MLIAVVLLLAGAALLLAGAEAFAENVTVAARGAGLTALALGVLVAGAEPEEALTAAIASARDRPGLAVGDALGANLVILTLALGLAAVLTPLPRSRRVAEYAAAASVAGALAVATLYNGVLSRVEGLLLLTAYAVAVGWVWRREQAPPAVGEAVGAGLGKADRRSARTALGFVGGGLCLMVGGGWLAVEGAQRFTSTLGLGDSEVGLTILALATSAEMLALVVAARRHDVAEVAVAGVVGAVAYNATVSLGVGALVAPLDVGSDPHLLGVAVLTAVLPLVVLMLRRPVGVLLVAVYLGALSVLLS